MSPTTSAKPKPAPAPAARAPRKPSRTKWYLLAGIVLLVGLGVAAKFSKRGKVDAIVVTIEKATVKTITQLVTATGKVQPETEVKISPEVSGEITDIPIKEGQSVKKGDLLVKIKPDTYVAQVEQQEAALASSRSTSLLSKARRVKAEQDFKQAQELYAKKFISDADFIAAKTNLDVAQADFDSSLAQIRRTEGSLSQSRDLLAKTTIYSPIDGTVSSLTSEVGERVAGTGSYGGAEIMRVADLKSMEIRVKVNENDIINVKVNDHAVINIDAFPSRRFNGSVSEISNSAQGSATSSAQQGSDDVTNFLVKIRVTDSAVQLRPGMSATVDIETQSVQNVVAVPIQSVTVRAAGGKTAEELQQQKAKETREKSGNDLELASERDAARRDRDKLPRVVFIKNGDTVKLQNVETGIADNTHIEVKTGVKAGDEIVSGSYAAISRRLKDGSKVSLEKPKPADGAEKK